MPGQRTLGRFGGPRSPGRLRLRTRLLLHGLPAGALGRMVWLRARRLCLRLHARRLCLRLHTRRPRLGLRPRDMGFRLGLALEGGGRTPPLFAERLRHFHGVGPLQYHLAPRYGSARHLSRWSWRVGLRQRLLWLGNDDFAIAK